jgi:transcriptional regulator with XRE-family HTH domain
MSAEAGRAALGRLLATHRAAVGWTQRRLAAHAFVDRSYVAHTESGQALPGRRFWVAVDDALSAGGELVAGFDAIDHHTVGDPSAPRTDGGADPARAAEASLAFADRAVCTNVGEETLEHLRWELGRLAVAYVHRDLDVVFGELVTARDTLFGLLQGRQRPRHTRELYFLAGAACLLLAHGSQNLGDERSALAQLRCAWTCVDQADHAELRTWAHGTAALIAEWSSQPARAVRIAATALATSTGPGRTRLAAIQARAAARLDDRATVRAAVPVVAEGDDGAGGDLSELGGLLTFPEAKRRYYLGATFGLLGDHETARTHATRAVELYSTGPVPARSYGDEALARLDLTRAAVHEGDLDAAGVALEPVLALPRRRRIQQLDAAMVATGRVLTAGSLARDLRARALVDRIAAHRRTGSARALSSGA